MPAKDICALPVKNIIDDDCALFLWATDGHIPDALQVIESWGFRYITIAFIWSKKTITGKQVATLGAWTMKNCEVCLLGTTGNMLKYKKSNNQYQLIEAVRTNHSVKPEKTRQRIEAIFPNLNRIELFARVKVDRWDAWGNEVDIDEDNVEAFCTLGASK